MNILLIKGGESVEHEVSLSSAAYIRSNLVPLGHRVNELVISKSGEFFYGEKRVTIDIARGFTVDGEIIPADVVFPMVHGFGGEDGRLQGLLEMMHLPYASEESLTSQIGMHKMAQMALFERVGIPTIPSIQVTSSSETEGIMATLGRSLVVKPESGGSSVGVIILPKADIPSLEDAIERTLLLDEKVIVQRYVQPLRELDVGALYSIRDKKLTLMGPIEIITAESFLDYEAKYHDRRTRIDRNPDIPPEVRKTMLDYAARAFDTVSGRMYMRLDFFLSGTKVILNEINTIPGMTPTSHYPVLAEEIGGVGKVLETLIENAILRAESQKRIDHSL